MFKPTHLLGIFLLFVIVMLLICNCSKDFGNGPELDEVFSVVGYEIGIINDKFFVRNTQIFVNSSKQTLLRVFWMPDENDNVVYSDSLKLNYTFLNGKPVLYNGEVAPVTVDTVRNDFMYSFEIQDKDRVITDWSLEDAIF